MTKKNTMKAYAVEFARKGGFARAAALTPERRREIAKLAAAAREAKKYLASNTKTA